MAILTGGLLGSSKNQIGGIVTYTVNGRTLARQKPAQYNDKKSDEQVAQRSKFANAVATYRKIQNAVKAGMIKRNPLHSPYNAFISKNVQDAFNENGVIFDNLKVSSGNITDTALTIHQGIGANEESILTIEEVQPGNNLTSFDNDNLYVLLKKDDTDDYELLDFGTRATCKEVEHQVPEWIQSGSYSVKAFFVKADNTDASETTSAATFTIGSELSNSVQ